MAIREEDLRLNIIVNGDPARKELLDVRTNISDLTAKVEQQKAELTAMTEARPVPCCLLRLRDTLFVEVPVESRHYSDSLFDAWGSGYRASLDSIRVYPVTKYITTENIVKVPDRKRWGIGVQAGYGVGKGGLSPYVGIGVSYNVVRF